MSALLTVENLNVSYGAIKAVQDVNFVVNNNEIVSLIGANGAGKTTILRTISGLEKPTKGRIL
ncbi:MAG TPA: ABC transporter ATP-binding protein, partial [Leuconostoc mesenteroides]|nr:ABC transporter ATP-binding protein [Leuconostoc mesenteroides]